MMAAIDADTGSTGNVKMKTSSAQQELGRGMGTKMSAEDQERLRKFEERQKSPEGFGKLTNSASSVIGVTPTPDTSNDQQPQPTNAVDDDSPKGPIGKTLKFINDNLEDKVVKENDKIQNEAAALNAEISSEINKVKTDKNSKKKKGKR
jgi:hypothetical protein